MNIIGQAKQKLQQDINQAVNRFIQTTQEKPSSVQGEISSKGSKEKVFHNREQLLVRMFIEPNYRAIYNMVVASSIPITIVLLKDSTIQDINTFVSIFSRGQLVLVVWWVMAFMAFLPVIFLPTIRLLKGSTGLYLGLLSVYIWVFSYLPLKLGQQNQLGFGSRMIVYCQMFRMLMKVYSYIRNKLLYTTDNKYKNWTYEGTGHKQPFIITLQDTATELRRFAYFFFAPTLIYRDSYELREQIDVGKALVHLFNFLASVFYCFIMYKLICITTIKELSQQMSLTNYFSAIMKMIFPSMVFLIVGFFGFLHSWMSAWAQLTRFSDRQFYQDWWNSAQFGSYYRRWNILVHDFLYYYIYMDLIRFFRLGKGLSQLITFLISAIVHQIVINLSIGFFFPFLFIIFSGPGILFFFYQNKKKMRFLAQNFFFWIQMYLGTSWVITSYLAELAARSIVSREQIPERWGSISFIVPSLFCLS